MPSSENKITSDRNVTTSKASSEHRLAVANLLLVAFNILLTAVVGIYTQKQLVTWQSQAELAKIQIILHPPNQVAGYSLTNTGLSTAKNLQVVVCLIRISETWSNTINDVSQFEFHLSNPAIPITQEIKKLDCPKEANGAINNAMLISIDNLAPSQTIDIEISLAEHVQRYEKVIGGKIYMYALITELDTIFDNKQNDSRTAFENGLKAYFDSGDWRIASFQASAYCPNCKIDSTEVVVSLGTTTELTTSNFIYENAKEYKISFDFSAHYYLPQNVDQNIKTPLYLLGVGLLDNKDIFIHPYDKKSFEEE